MDSQFRSSLGGVDLFLLDQILKGNIHKEMEILTVGCGYGKNLKYFLENHYSISGIDKNPEAIQALRALIQEEYPHQNPQAFHIRDILLPPEQTSSYDAILALALLHNLPVSDHGKALKHMWAMVKPEGLLFIRTYVKGIGEDFSLLEEKEHSEHPDLQSLLSQIEELGGTHYEPSSIFLSKRNRPILSVYLIKKS